MLENAESILEKAKTLWFSSKKAYRDAKLEVGRLLHKYVLSRLKEADGLSEYKRSKLGVSRSLIVNAICLKLKITQSQCSDLIQTSAAVDLLSDNGNVGELPYSSLQYFRKLVGRSKNRLRRFYNKDGEVEPSTKEVWFIRGTDPTKWKKVFQKAVLENWDRFKIKASLPQNPLNDEEFLQDNCNSAVPRELLYAAKIGTPKDVASMIVELIESSTDPDRVRDIVLRKLSYAKIP